MRLVTDEPSFVNMWQSHWHYKSLAADVIRITGGIRQCQLATFDLKIHTLGLLWDPISFSIIAFWPNKFIARDSVAMRFNLFSIEHFY